MELWFTNYYYVGGCIAAAAVAGVLVFGTWNCLDYDFFLVNVVLHKLICLLPMSCYYHLHQYAIAAEIQMFDYQTAAHSIVENTIRA